jgi:hypothetical protein
MAENSICCGLVAGEFIRNSPVTSSPLAFPTSDPFYDEKDETFVSYIRPACKTRVKFSFCHSCGKVHSQLQTCNQLFCKKCYLQKKKKVFVRLKGKLVNHKRLIHIVIGFPKTNDLPNKSNKRRMEGLLSKFHRCVRKEFGLKFQGLRIFDLADDGCYDHYHYAIVPESKMMNHRQLNLDVKKLREMLVKATKGFSKLIIVLGFRSKKGLFDYFSKRVAGRYGHGNTVFFLEDIMSYDDYQKQFFNVRKIVIIGNPKGLSCNTAQSRSTCPYCGSTDVVNLGIYGIDEDFVLPDWCKTYSEELGLSNLNEFT